MTNQIVKSLKIAESRSCYKGKIIEVIEDDILRPDGRRHVHTSVTHPGAVVILPKLNSQVVLMVRQYRHTIGKMLLEFPAGTLEVSERPEQCAHRELQEEVKHAAKQWIDLGTIYPAPGFCSEKQYLYFASDLYESAANLDEDEILNSEQIRIDQLDKMIDSGEIEDSKSIAIFMRSRIRGLI